MPGVEWMLLNGELFVGDPRQFGFRGVPALLRAGTNRVFVKARAEQFEVSFEKHFTRLAIETQDIRWPGEGPKVTDWDDCISFPVFNVAATPVPYLHHHYGKPTIWNEACRPRVSEWRDGAQIAPLGMHGAWNYTWNFTEPPECDPNSGDTPRDVWLPECLFANGDKIAERKVLRRPADPKHGTTNNVTYRVREADAAAPALAKNTDCATLLQGTLRRASAYDDLARFHQQAQWYHSGRICERFDDSNDLSSFHGAGPKMATPGPTIAILGNRDTFKGWNNFVPDEPAFRARDGAVEVGGVEYTGDDLAGWTIVRSPGRTLRIHFDTGAKGARLALLLAAAWKGEVWETALFRVDPSEPRGWRRLEVKQLR